jgi:similar to stage IV sporulation protein
MCISLSDFYKLKSITKKTGTRVSIQKRNGLPFYVPRMKRRKFFIIGLVLSMIFWIWMSAFIWAVEIQGNFHVTNDVLLNYLSKQKINVGMKRNDVNIEELEKALRREYNIITWTSARIDGTRLIIQIKENEMKEPEVLEKLDEERGYDLVAGKDGTVVSIITRSGLPLVFEGSEVVEGDVLVQGGLPIFNDDLTVRNYQYCHADADIYLQTTINQVEILPINYEEKLYSGKEKKVPYFEILGWRMKFGFGRNKFAEFDIIDENKQVRLLENFYLPLYFGSETVREYEIIEKKHESDEAKSIFTGQTIKIMENLSEKGVQIIEKSVTMSKDKVNWYIDIHFDVIEKTGKSVPTTLSAPIIMAEEPE